MTRRPIKPQPFFDKDSGYWYHKPDKPGAIMSNHPPDSWLGFANSSKFGMPGDRLWARETFAMFAANHIINGQRFAYKASMTPDSEEIRQEYIRCGFPYQWHPSIHMPRTAARIILEITDVKVERLQSISGTDAVREGIERIKYNGEGIKYNGYKCYTDPSSPFPMVDPVASFGSLWQSIYGPDSWQSNPWVWAISFKRIQP